MIKAFMKNHNLKYNQQFRLAEICGGWALFKINKNNTIELISFPPGLIESWKRNCIELCKHALEYIRLGKAKVAISKQED